MDFWPFLWICLNHKNGQKSIFYFERWKFFLAHLIHLERQFFCIFYTFWFDQKKWAKLKKTHFHAWPIFSVFGPKMPKISIFMKKILRTFLWVILDRKGFLYFWWTPLFEPARAILLKRVQYQPVRLKFRVLYPPQQTGSSRFKYLCLSKV